MPRTLLRRTARLLAAGSAAVGLALAGASATAAKPLESAGPPQVDHVNLGDSYSAAFGTGGVAPTFLQTLDPEVAVPCLQGAGPDHVSELDRHPRVTLVVDAACGRATTQDMRTIVQTVPAVRAGLAEAELVSLTLGGNDVAWVETLLQCSAFADTADVSCDVLLGSAPIRVAGAAASAGQTITTIDGVTDGRIVVLGYPHLVEPTGLTLPNGVVLMTAERAVQINALTDALNAALEAAVESQGAAFVDVTDRFAGHGLGSADPWIALDVQNLGDPNNLHPTVDGYLEGYRPALMSEVSIGRLGR
ncbi:GDSL-type esterase/lipase family protein [Georgenia muralis]|uniref:GDSL-like lipase/acylhydrolase family protein n=1 Tax=Georgenia muralis TaxID=154117 RepID=A0A3N5A679_9MICO|nr:GDSL-type esterase/lipase family protein [Georgenia muralis]RPF28895.1 GDSL-like lipase/acylhydrolase family protein [Georgenia muralis]